MNDPATLAQRLSDQSALAPDWQTAFARVRREDFIPNRLWVHADDGYRPLERATDPARWRGLVYADEALLTQVDAPSGTTPAPLPASSAGKPSVLARMLAALDVRDGHRVLEIGTGNGYNAALLCARLGESQVTTVEMDPALTDQARHALAAAGYSPTVVTGDGDGGWTAEAPYDRVIATRTTHRIPVTWLDQTSLDGVIVLPWGTELHDGVLLRLTVGIDPEGQIVASGPVIGDAPFPWMPTQTPAERDVTTAVQHRSDATISRTPLDPRHVIEVGDAAFAAGVLAPDCGSHIEYGADGAWTLWLASAFCGSRASVDYVPGADDFEVRQYGPRSLWDEVEAGYRWWRQAGCPERTRYGLTVTRTGQHVWLDQPGNRVPVPS